MMKTVYYTDRLELRLIDKTYAHQVLDYFIRNRDFLTEWEDAKRDEFFTIDWQENWLSRELKALRDGNSVRLWIFKKGDTSRIIGTVALNNIVRGAFWSCHLGYKLDKDEINNGYMTEAVKVVKNIAFNDLGLHRIEANIMPKNKRSLRVVEKLNFYNEGIAYRYLRINGKWEDHIHMVLLNEEVQP